MQVLRRFGETLIKKKVLLLLSILLGVNFAFYFSAYLKTDVIPFGSTRFLAYTLFVSGMGSLLYFVALLWAERRFSSYSVFRYALFSFLLGTILFFTTTSQWLEPEFYVRSTLPISYELFLPWYASPGMAYFTGAIFFATLVFILFALLLPKKDEILTTLTTKLRTASFSGYGQIDWILVVAFVLVAFVLRVINLEALPPHIEEYQHLNAAKQLLAGVPKEQVYQRGLYLVTMPVKLFFSLFGMEVWAARLPGVLINSFALIPLYLLTRRFNRTVAVLSSLLYITSPWVIALSRSVREYAYHPLLFYLVLGSALILLESIPKGFMLSQWRAIFDKKKFLHFGILVFFVLFVVFFDPFSSFKIVALLYVIFGFFFVGRLDFHDRQNKLVFATISLAGIIFIGFFSALLLTNPAISETFGNPFRALRIADPFENFRNGNAKLLFGQFFFQPPTQWYYERTLLFPLLSFFFVLWWSWHQRKQALLPWFLVVLFTVSLTAFVLLYTFIYAPRFFLHLQLWYIPLLAIGIYGWYLISTVLVKNLKLRNLIWVLFVVATVNFQQFFVHTKSTELPVTYAIHMGFDELDDYMLAHVQPQDVLLSKFYTRYVIFQGVPRFANIYETSYDEDIIKQNDSGWIVVDGSRYWSYRKKLLLENFYLDEIEIEYIGEFPDPTSGLSNYIWHWDKMP